MNTDRRRRPIGEESPFRRPLPDGRVGSRLPGRFAGSLSPPSVFIGAHRWFLLLCVLPSSATADEAGTDAILQAPTLEDAASAADRARREAPSDPLAASHGRRSTGGHRAPRSRAYTAAVELAVARCGPGRRRRRPALDAVLGLVAYCPRSEAGDWRPPEIPSSEPWAARSPRRDTSSRRGDSRRRAGPGGVEGRTRAGPPWVALE